MQQNSRERRQTAHPCGEKHVPLGRGVHSDPLPQSRAWGSMRGLKQRKLKLSLCPTATRSGRCVHVVRQDEDGLCLCGLPPHQTQTPSLVARKTPENSPVETYYTKQLSNTPQTCECYRKKKPCWKLWRPGGAIGHDNSLWCIIWLGSWDRKRNIGQKPKK